MVKGSKHSEASKKKLRLANLRREEIGWHHTPEALEKIREAGKRRKGMKFSEEHKRNMGLARIGKHKEENSKLWKGNNVGYRRFHQWLDVNYKKSNRCQNSICPKIGSRIEWALLHGKEHEKNRKNYIRLCSWCHRNYDRGNLKIVLDRKGKLE